VVAAVMSDPGARMSTHVPWLLKLDMPSCEVVAPTVIALGARAGDDRQASSASFPAATTTSTPASCAAATAASSLCDTPPPRESEITAVST